MRNYMRFMRMGFSLIFIFLLNNESFAFRLNSNQLNTFPVEYKFRNNLTFAALPEEVRRRVLEFTKTPEDFARLSKGSKRDLERYRSLSARSIRISGSE